MFDVKQLKGADISTEFCGIKLPSPFVLSSGPLSYAAEGLIRAHRAGAGAVVTKTIRLSAAVNPVNHIGKINKDSLINCEKWADSEAEVWFNREIPMAKEAGAVVIASVGHTLPEAEALVQDCEKAGADMIELVSYTEDTLIPMLKAAKERVSIPVICKLSGNWPDPAGTAGKCLKLGADAISAIDSIGPTLKIDIRNARPAMFSKDGYGWLSGGAMRPIALRINSEIARNGCANLMGIGGVTCAEDAVEYLMVGARAVGLHSIAILKGVEYFTKLCKDTAMLLDQLGYRKISSAVGAALPNFPKQERVAKLEFHYEPDYQGGDGLTPEQAVPGFAEVEPGLPEDAAKREASRGLHRGCINCGRCVDACSYDARTLEFPVMKVDQNLCRSCGLCVSVCPTGALTATIVD